MSIERRRSERANVNIKAELVSEDISYTGVLENLSEDGMFMKTAPVKHAKGFIPGTIYKLNIQKPHEETLNLSCEVVWFHTETSSFGLIFRIGMKIINPPQSYKELLEVL